MLRIHGVISTHTHTHNTTHMKGLRDEKGSRNSPLVVHATTDELEKVVDALETEVFQDGECIVREGEVGHFFYILESGEISVHQRETGGGGDGDGGGEGGNDEGMGPQVSVLK